VRRMRGEQPLRLWAARNVTGRACGRSVLLFVCWGRGVAESSLSFACCVRSAQCPRHTGATAAPLCAAAPGARPGRRRAADASALAMAFLP